MSSFSPLGAKPYHVEIDLGGYIDSRVIDENGSKYYDLLANSTDSGDAIHTVNNIFEKIREEAITIVKIKDPIHGDTIQIYFDLKKSKAFSDMIDNPPEVDYNSQDLKTKHFAYLLTSGNKEKTSFIFHGRDERNDFNTTWEKFLKEWLIEFSELENRKDDDDDSQENWTISERLLEQHYVTFHEKTMLIKLNIMLLKELIKYAVTHLKYYNVNDNIIASEMWLDWCYVNEQKNWNDGVQIIIDKLCERARILCCKKTKCDVQIAKGIFNAVLVKNAKALKKLQVNDYFVQAYGNNDDRRTATNHDRDNTNNIFKRYLRLVNYKGLQTAWSSLKDHLRYNDEELAFAITHKKLLENHDINDEIRNKLIKQYQANEIQEYHQMNYNNEDDRYASQSRTHITSPPGGYIRGASESRTYTTSPLVGDTGGTSQSQTYTVSPPVGGISGASQSQTHYTQANGYNAAADNAHQRVNSVHTFKPVKQRSTPKVRTQKTGQSTRRISDDSHVSGAYEERQKLAKRHEKEVKQDDYNQHKAIGLLEDLKRNDNARKALMKQTSEDYAKKREDKRKLSSKSKGS